MSASLQLRGFAVAPRPPRDLDLAAGGRLALLGANGCGKSSLLRAMAGLTPHHGTLALDGVVIPPEARAAAGLALVPEGRRLFATMSVRDNLLVAAGRRRERPALAATLALLPELEPLLPRPAWTLSGGQQQLAALGRALMAEPRILLLDEPSLGLAPLWIARLLEALGQLGATTTVLVAEQNRTVAEAIGPTPLHLR